MSQDLTIACSTFGNRIKGALNVYNSLDNAESNQIKFLIIHQTPKNINLCNDSYSVMKTIKEHPNIGYIRDTSIGVTKSRNIAIEAISTRYMWVMDDDLVFTPQCILKILNTLHGVNIACHTYESLTASGNKRASYPIDLSPVSGKNILRYASFEMIIDVHYLKEKKISFREDMGVGDNKITMGEESVLIADIQRAGGRVLHHSICVNIHPDDSTGTVISNNNSYSKGVIIRRVFGQYKSIYYYLREVNRILRNRKGEFGVFSKRAELIKSVTKGLLSE